MFMINVLNRSTMLSDEELDNMTYKVNTQVCDHFGVAYSTFVPLVRRALNVDDVVLGKDNGLITIVDLDSNADALGWHSESTAGMVFGVVSVGAAQFANVPVSSVLSHEVLEMVADPTVNMWAELPGGSEWAYEICDPVESDSYEIDGVTVSNFVLPAFFDPDAVGPFDYLGKLSASFSIGAGGYAVVRESGTLREVFGFVPGSESAVRGYRVHGSGEHNPGTGRAARRLGKGVVLR